VWNYRNRSAGDRWFAHAKPDFVVISQGSNTDGVDWALACKERKIRYALIAHAASEHSWPDDAQVVRIRSACAGASNCFFVCHANAELTSRQIGAHIERMRVVRNPYKVSYRASPPWPQAKEELKLACVGRLDVGPKGQELLLAVLSDEKWKRRSLSVTFLGRGPNEGVLRRLAAKYQLTNATFGGFVKDIQSVWAEHHALILPSRIEGLPLAVVEAMLCGRPCIVTNAGGNAELIQDDVTGFVATAATVADIDRALERAWQRRNDLRAMGRLAGEEVRKHIPENPAGEFVRILLELAGSSQTMAARDDAATDGAVLEAPSGVVTT
jgi:glycosyltransferase involved in cell wall biosynthesis